MKKFLSGALRSAFIACILMLSNLSSYASHIVAAELRYKWITGLQYEVTVYLYGDCGPASSGAFSSLPTSRPHICVFDGPTLVTSFDCNIVMPSAGVEVTPVCPDSLGFTQCTSTSYTLPGIKKFVYRNTVTLPGTSANWRFVYTGGNAVSSSGRAAAITNISGAGGTTMQLIDTLNNSATNTRGHNSSPVLTVEPVPFFCRPNYNCFNPGAVDIDDVSPSQPAGDSLVFSLVSAQNGSGSSTSCPAPGGPVTYIGTHCTGTPVSGSTPLSVTSCASTAFNFNTNTGQLCFDPSIDQRSTVVYNIQEYRDDTVSTIPLIVNHVKVGTMQREMTFLVKPCTLTTPLGKIDSFAGPGDTLSSTHFRSCANSGSFNIYVNPRTSDTSLHITVTATGLSAGFTYVVTGDGTSTPHVTLTGNTSLIIPGTYIIYLTFTDNHCPLVGSKTYAFTFDILPVPTISASTVVPATCNDSANVRFVPGGTGKPWTVKISYNPFHPFPLVDTFRIHTDTAAFIDSFKPGSYFMTIFTNVSNECHVTVPFVVDTPHFDITVTGTDPTYCGAKDGRLNINDLNPGALDSVMFKFQGILQPRQGFVASATGTDTIFNLLAGTYDSIVVLEGLCATNPAGPVTLVNPPFTWRTVTTKDVTRCGFCNGIDTLFGLHPDQLDTITYNYQKWGGGPTSPQTASSFIGPDSIVVLSGLCAGLYSGFTVKTAGVCSYSVPGTFAIDSPSIRAEFDSVIQYGCHGDTLTFRNWSTYESLADSDLTFKWFFGDGTTDTSTNPKHIYTNTNAASYVVKLYITNTKCFDSSISTLLLDNHVNADFNFAPDPFVCQDSLVTFTSTSTGNNLTYYWEFDDGGTDLTANPTHSFKRTGKYNVKLIAANHLVPLPTNGSTFYPCYDTVVKSISVDSLSDVSIKVTDTVVCMGQSITFKGVYSELGDTLVAWSFDDGNATVGMDPIIHSFEREGVFTVGLNVKYRSCPENSATRVVEVRKLPSLYLGADQSICPGGTAIRLSDDRNNNDPKASWKWNTGERTSAINVVKPGYYSAVVTVDGCSASDTVWIQRDCYMDIPNVFSPNGDGTNDYFFPRQVLTRGVTTFKMEVFNRWGQIVYETNSIDGRGWDGQFGGKDQPQGVYVYRIEAKFKDGQIESHQGNVTLLR